MVCSADEAAQGAQDYVRRAQQRAERCSAQQFGSAGARGTAVATRRGISVRSIPEAHRVIFRSATVRSSRSRRLVSVAPVRNECS